MNWPQIATAKKGEEEKKRRLCGGGWVRKVCFSRARARERTSARRVKVKLSRHLGGRGRSSFLLFFLFSLTLQQPPVFIWLLFNFNFSEWKNYKANFYFCFFQKINKKLFFKICFIFIHFLFRRKGEGVKRTRAKCAVIREPYNSLSWHTRANRYCARMCVRISPYRLDARRNSQAPLALPLYVRLGQVKLLYTISDPPSRLTHARSLRISFPVVYYSCGSRAKFDIKRTKNNFFWAVGEKKCLSALFIKI